MKTLKTEKPQMSTDTFGAPKPPRPITTPTHRTPALTTQTRTVHRTTRRRTRKNTQRNTRPTNNDRNQTENNRRTTQGQTLTFILHLATVGLRVFQLRLRRHYEIVLAQTLEGMGRQSYLHTAPPDEKVGMMILDLSNLAQRIGKVKTSQIGFEPKLFLERIRLENPSRKMPQTLPDFPDDEWHRILARSTFSQ